MHRSRTFAGRRLLVVASLLTLAACQPRANVDLYVNDLIAAQAGENGLEAPIQIELPQATKTYCERDSGKMLGEVGKLVNAAKFTGCETRDFNDFAKFEGTIPIRMIGVDGVLPDTKDPYYVFVSRNDAVCDEDKPCYRYLVGLATTTNFKTIGDAIAAVSSDAMGRPRTQAPRLTGSIENDSRSSVTMMPRYGFLDGQPWDSDMGAVLVERRQSKKVQISDVDATRIANGEAVSVAFIGVPRTPGAQEATPPAAP